MNLETRIENYIKTKQMLSKGDRVLVSVSGGPDSVALLSVLIQVSEKWSLNLNVMHFNHGLRGKESEEDEVFVTRLCHELGIPCCVKKLNLKPSTSLTQPSSLQELARNRRYEILTRMALEIGAKKIAVGHTADDQAETLIMWIVRGAGSLGLSGIPPVRDPYVIRPLLETSRSEILGYLQRRELEYRTDSSNNKPMYWRNQVRQEVMPILKRYNPNVTKTIARQADIVREEEAYLSQLAHQALEQVQEVKTSNGLTLNRDRLVNLPLAMQRRVLRMAIREVSGTTQMSSFDTIEAVLKQVVKGRSGVWGRLQDVCITREYELIRFSCSQMSMPAPQSINQMYQFVAIPSQVVWPLTGQTMNVSTSLSSEQNVLKDLNRNRAIFDADAFSPSLVLRNWKAGDYFYPFGMDGKRKKLQDFFSDVKVARSQRSKVPLLVAPEGIIWVGGYRTDHRFRVTEATRTVLMVDLSQAGSSI